MFNFKTKFAARVADYLFRYRFALTWMALSFTVWVLTYFLTNWLLLRFYSTLAELSPGVYWLSDIYLATLMTNLVQGLLLRRYQISFSLWMEHLFNRWICCRFNSAYCRSVNARHGECWTL